MVGLYLGAVKQVEEDEGKSSSSTYPSSKWICAVVIFACAVDAADKALLPATFKAMEDLMQVGPRDLGALSFAQSIAFSVALPFWGSMMRYYRPRDLLALGCLLWGMFTLVVSTSSSFVTHFLMRLFIGAALAVVMPIGQAMICDLVPEHERGTAFGIMKSVCSVLAEVSTFVTTALARSSLAGTSGWRVIYGVVALMSLITAWLVKSQVPANLSASAPVKGQTWLQEQVRVVRTAAQKPSFCFMVLQGVTGGVPWHAFAFLPFYFQQNGYSDVEAAQILLYGGFGGMMSGVLGGVLGDRFHRCWPYSGRCLAAFMSVVLGMVFFFAVMRWSESSFWFVATIMFLFQLTGTWTQSAALRPMCGDIVQNSHDRAQILALWIALEGIISSICGAPLAGRLSEAFGYSLNAGDALGQGQNVDALRKALLGVSMLPWAVCAIFWIPMIWSYPKDAGQSARNHFSA
ncbi:unnamed protein product [Cladocopium goreaui]|uniref:Major facilitator superfamily (MFS) profile domain-containing protein n=1 Tax=Cladocopium goreaui TaxID=2562237 RepID=A0A9P1CS06_9DINO|nr:unnamed protein product [Cladocopium goreaui]|mmetsp:Transcript_73979/g.163384  ORF Transcript_73979/g.163384 Transcript_73979/m.163384 type:complete len:461 (+) Transcript_73979:46-1428(+)